VILVANKSESRAADAGVLEAYALGLGEPIRLSAEHGEGMAELATVLAPLVDAAGPRRPRRPRPRPTST
jgi:GTPase